MKKLSMLFAALLMAGGAMFTSCGDDNPNNGPTGDITITTDPESPIELGAEAQDEVKVNVTITGTSEWSVAAASGQDWLTADKGSYTSRFYLSATANDTGEERSTTVTITAGDKTHDLKVIQTAGKPIFIGPYDSYLGTWTLTAPTMFEGADPSVTLNLTISAGPDVEMQMQDGSTQTFKGIKIKGWSKSGVGNTFEVPGFFLPQEADQGNILIMSKMDIGEFAIEGENQMFSFKGIAPTEQGVYAFSGDYMILAGFFADQEANSILWGPQSVMDQNNQEYVLYTGTYTYDAADGWDTADINDCFVPITDDATTTRTGGTASVDAKPFNKAEATRTNVQPVNRATAVRIR